MSAAVTPQRLLFVSNLFPDAGEPYRGLDNVTLLHELKAQREIRVVALRPTLRAWLGGAGTSWRCREMDQVFQPLYVPVRYVPKAGSVFNHHLAQMDLRQKLANLRETFSWDLLLASWLYPDGWAAQQLAATHGTPSVLIAQGSDVHRYLHSSPRRRAILQAALGSSAIITRSRSLKTLLCEAGVSEAKLHAIHNGVDTDNFRGGAQADARAELGLPDAGKIILFVGNLLPVKNPELLIKAFAKIKDASVQLAMAGKGPMRAPLQQLAQQEGVADRVKFLGPLKAAEIATWMRASDLLCMSSHNEGLPNVVLEAMACGLPVVATDVGGIHEIIDADWKGRLVPSNDEAALAAALQQTLSMPLQRDVIARYGAGLSWQATASACEAVLQSAMASKA